MGGQGFWHRPGAWRWSLLLGFMAVVLTGGGLAWVATQPGGGSAPDTLGPAPLDPAPTRMVEVFVSGAVLHPGLYRLPAGNRIADALTAAGGLLPDADPERLPNLAGRLGDGRQVKVPRRTRRATGGANRVDVNTAGIADLMTIPGMDSATAQAIVDYRDRFGGFFSLTELHTGLGLDPAIVALLRRYLVVGS